MRPVQLCELTRGLGKRARINGVCIRLVRMKLRDKSAARPFVTRLTAYADAFEPRGPSGWSAKG